MSLISSLADALNNSFRVCCPGPELARSRSRLHGFRSVQFSSRAAVKRSANKIKTSRAVYANYRHFLGHRLLNKSLSHCHQTPGQTRGKLLAVVRSGQTLPGDILLRLNIRSLNCLRLLDRYSLIVICRQRVRLSVTVDRIFSLLRLQGAMLTVGNDELSTERLSVHARV